MISEKKEKVKKEEERKNKRRKKNRTKQEKENILIVQKTDKKKQGCDVNLCYLNREVIVEKERIECHPSPWDSASARSPFYQCVEMSTRTIPTP